MRRIAETTTFARVLITWAIFGGVIALAGCSGSTAAKLIAEQDALARLEEHRVGIVAKRDEMVKAIWQWSRDSPLSISEKVAAQCAASERVVQIKFAAVLKAIDDDIDAQRSRVARLRKETRR